MKLAMAVFLVVGSISITGVVAATGGLDLDLEGTLTIRGASVVDSDTDEPADSHAAFLLRGASAQALFEALPGEPVRDECLGDGTIRKSAGNLSCLKRAGDAGYECDFAIKLDTQSNEAGRVC